VQRPAILLADEPTGNLDSRTSEEILDLFDNLHREGQTIVIVTHEADIARRCRRIVRLRDGQVESDAPVLQEPLNLPPGALRDGVPRHDSPRSVGDPA
jgi:putative ABC transport system ATP-binding protein